MDALVDLARLYGIQTEYLDVEDREQTASPEALLRVLQCLDVPIERPEEAERFQQAYLDEQARQWLAPVNVIWDDRPQEITLGNVVAENERVECHIQLENGEELSFPATIEATSPARGTLTLPARLPPGYHDLQIERGGETALTRIFAAPAQAFRVPAVNGEQHWGIFLPLHALHRRNSWGVGDFSDLDAFVEWTCNRGGQLVATLPLLASFFDGEGDVSPYTPASRLFWNELYLAIESLPEFEASKDARALVASAGFETTRAALKEGPIVDYRGVMSAKRDVLEKMASSFFDGESERRATFDHFTRTNPDAVGYAQFRAACEKLGRPWTDWPTVARNGQIQVGDFDPAVGNYHLFVQWLVDEQLGRLAGRSEAAGAAWYLDLPLGVHPDGYDVWRYGHAFAQRASGGAPPDSFFTKGQSWGFPPFHPRRLRESGYEYFIRVVRHHLQYAGMLRIDHVMGLHRLYWVPQGLPATDGAYVRYEADELYALLAIESHRASARIIGENLGTVPPEVDQAMDLRQLGQLYVGQYELNKQARELPQPPANSVASLNTHDMPTFAAFWNGLDIADRVDLGLMTESEAAAEQESRAELRQYLMRQLQGQGLLDVDQEDTHVVLTALTSWLGESDAEVVLVNLEDTWLETRPQNTPGTVTERVNWRLKAKYSFEEFREQPLVLDLLHALDRVRRTRAVEQASKKKPHINSEEKVTDG